VKEAELVPPAEMAVEIETPTEVAVVVEDKEEEKTADSEKA